MLLSLLFTVPPAVCGPLGVSIAAIANWDFPEVWPEELPTLLSAVCTAGSSQQVRASTCAPNELCVPVASLQAPLSSPTTAARWTALHLEMRGPHSRVPSHVRVLFTARF